jgi:hypothetical protein
MGSITTGNTNAASTSVNMTTEGTEDWLVHVASPSSTPLRGLNPVPASKRLGGGDLLLNFDWLNTGGTPTAFTQASTITKTATAADNVQGAALSTTTGAGYFHASVIDYGFRIRCRADTGTRTLNIYVGHFSSIVTVTARLLDGSAADATFTNNSGAATVSYRKFSLTYTADSVTELVVTVLLTTSHGSTPNLLFNGASLALNTAGLVYTGVTLLNPTPAEGDLAATRADARYTPIGFDVSNPSEQPYSIWIKFANDERGFTVYDSVTGFQPPFTGVWTAPASPDLDGHLTVELYGGWQGEIEWIGVGGGADATILGVRPGQTGSDDPPDAP